MTPLSCGAVLLWSGLSAHAASAAAHESTAQEASATFGHPPQARARPLPPPNLPPPTSASLQMRPPSPQWDVGLTLGGGVYEVNGNFDHGGVRLGAELDSLYLRRRDTDFGLGWTLSVSTFNFADARFSAGVVGGGALFEPIVVELALRGGVLSDGRGVSPALNPELRIGLRSLNLHGSYGHAHFLTIGSDLTLSTDAADTRPRATLYAALRFDVMWLVAPVKALF